MDAPLIISMRDLNQHTADVVTRIRASGRPAILTKNGQALLILTPADDSAVLAQVLTAMRRAPDLFSDTPLGDVVPAPAPRTETRRGSRLPVDWQPDTELVTWARQHGIPDDYARRETEKFRTYWLAESGARAAKRDWRQAWQHWLLKAIERVPPRQQINGTPIGAATEKAAGWVGLGKDMDERQGAWATASPDLGVRRPILEAGPDDARGME